AITGLGGDDLLIGDGLYVLATATDTVDGGAGDDLIDLSNREYQRFGPFVAQSPYGPPDRVTCGEGNDRVDVVPSQVVPGDCEGARFNDALDTVALRPARGAGGALVFDVPCPARRFYPTPPVGVCDGTVSLVDPNGGRVLGAAAYSAAGGSRAAVAVRPAAALPAGP